MSQPTELYTEGQIIKVDNQEYVVVEWVNLPYRGTLGTLIVRKPKGKKHYAAVVCEHLRLDRRDFRPTRL